LLKFKEGELMKHRQLFRAMMRPAVEKHGMQIRPTDYRRRFCDCLTEDKEMLILWYNTPDGSTHLIRAKIKPEAN